MKKNNVLVSAVGGDLGQSVVRCLRESPCEISIFGCDMNPYAAGRVDVDTFSRAPSVDNGEEYREFLMAVIQRNTIDHVILISEAEIRFFNSHRDKFSGLVDRFVIHGAHVLDTFTDKWETIRFFEESGIPFPKTFLPGEYRDQLSYPVVLKKRQGSGSQNFYVVQNSRQLELALLEPHDMVIQEFLPGNDNEFTAAIFKNDKTHFRIAFKRILGRGGYSQQAELVHDRLIDDFLDLVASRIQFTGSLNVQFRVLPGRGCIPFEINPRFSSTVYTRHVFGFSDVQWWIDIREGKQVAFTPRYSGGIAVRKISEVFFDLK